MLKKTFILLFSVSVLASCASEPELLPIDQLNQTNPVNALATTKISKTKFVEVLAGKLHDIWRAPRKKADGTYEPRIKSTTDQKWIKANNKKELDIANTNYEDLPEDWKKENRASALVATNIIYKAVSNKVDMTDSKFVEESSASIHAEWLKRNAWAKGGELDVPYSKLPEVEKAKDREIILLARALKTIYDADI